MTPNRLFQKIALSTLLLSAVASPSAFAADTSDMAALTKPAVHFSVTAWQDPVKLAETYAPDTVEEWKQTMAAYKEALGANVQMTFSSASLVRAVPVDIIAADEQPALVESFVIRDDVTAAPAVSLNAAFGEGVALPTLSASAIALPELNEAGSNVTVTFATTTEALPISAFAQGWLDLNAAVQANDEAAIKQALVHQLALYKEEIAKLKAGVEPMTLPAMATLRALPAAETAPSGE
jgi:hypothetical protein